MTPRRFYVLKRLAARITADRLGSVWHRKQIEIPGTDLPESFPYRTKLTEVGYLALEDLEDATTEELQQVGFTSHEAAAVLAAL